MVPLSGTKNSWIHKDKGYLLGSEGERVSEESVFNGNRISAKEYGTVWERSGGNSTTTVQMFAFYHGTVYLTLVKVLDYILCIFCHNF